MGPRTRIRGNLFVLDAQHAAGLSNTESFSYSDTGDAGRCGPHPGGAHRHDARPISLSAILRTIQAAAALSALLAFAKGPANSRFHRENRFRRASIPDTLADRRAVEAAVLTAPHAEQHALLPRRPRLHARLPHGPLFDIPVATVNGFMN